MEKIITIIKKNKYDFIKDINDILETNKSEGYLFIVSENDTYDESLKDELAEVMDLNPKAAVVTPKKLFQFPNRMAGTMIRLSAVHEYEKKTGNKLRLNPDLGYDYEADFLLRLIDEFQFMVQVELKHETGYLQGDIGDSNFAEFQGVYDKEWYLDEIDEFIMPLINRYVSKDKPLPFLVQFYIMYLIKCRFDANLK